MSRLILLRHGESVWNKRNLFTGWVDVPLSQKGIEEALSAGDLIKDIAVDFIFTTPLIRASMTAMLAMSRHNSGKVPVVMHHEGSKLAEWGKIFSTETMKSCIPTFYCWQLNERMYGELQGLNKKELAEKFGKEQVQIWRRSYNTPPPNGESLEMTAARTIPFFEEAIVPSLQQGSNVFVCAHGNSLRSIIMDIDGLSQEEVVSLEIPTGVPIYYGYENGSFKNISR